MSNSFKPGDKVRLTRRHTGTVRRVIGGDQVEVTEDQMFGRTVTWRVLAAAITHLSDPQP